MEFLNFEGLAYFKEKENSQFAPVESTTTASHAYEIGQYFWYEGKLYEATAAIALGDTFVTSGDSANCELADIADDISDARERIGTLEGQVTDLETNKANIDGYYSEMTVGNAEQIVSTVGVEDKTPYNFRTAGGSVDIGDREEDMVVGGTVAWNQLVTTDTNVSKTKSDDIITVNDAVAGNAEDLVVSFEPQQDLHGQDAPYPAGGGKNILPLDLDSIKASNTDGTWNGNVYTRNNVTFTVQQDSDGNITGILINASSAASANAFLNFGKKTDKEYLTADTAYVLSGCPSNGGNNTYRLHITDGSTTKIDTGSGVTFTPDSTFVSATNYYVAIRVASGYQPSNVLFKPMICLASASNPATFAPYSNICPITGWTGASAYVTGVNVWDEEWEMGTIDPSTGENSNSSSRWRSKNYIPIKPNTQYCYRWGDDGYKTTGRVAYYDQNKNFISGNASFPSGENSFQNPYVFTTPVNAYYMRFSPAAGLTYDNNTCINYPSTDTDYHAYSGTTYPISWQSTAGTVYGGTLELVSGELVVDRTKFVVDNNTRMSVGSFIESTNTCRVYVPRYPMMKPNSTSSINIIANSLKAYAPDYIYTNDIEGISENKNDSSNGLWIRINKSRLSAYTQDGVKAYLGENPVEVVYELSEPITYQLTPQQVQMLLGTNNVWNDIGSTELTYLGTTNEITAQSGHKYLTRVNGSSTVVNGSGQTLSGEKGRDNIFDLTQMFGSSIADYVYSLENTSAGDGVTWFTDLFPKPYYSYNAGQLMSVNTSAHITRGFNAWDGTYEANKRLANPTTGAVETANGYNLTGYIPILPNTVYYKAKTDSARGLFYDYDKNVIPESSWSMSSSAALITTPPNAYYVRITATNAYINTFILNLSWDGERDGEYEAYEEHTYALDESLTLRGIPKLDSGNKLYYDGDTYEDDGTVTRKWAEYTVTGNETFYVNSGYIKSDASDAYIEVTSIYSQMQIFNAKGIANKTLLLQVNTSIWNTTGYPNTFTTNSNQLHMNFANAVVGITDYTQETTSSARDKIKAYCKALYDAGTPLKFILPLKNTTTEEADPYTNPQVVNDFGTEEYVDYAVLNNEREVSIPVGHVTMYQANLRAKLEMAPQSPDGDGDYIVRQSNGENEYVPLVIPQELPDSPTSNGTYILQATVSGGTTTIAWVSAT